MSADEPAGRECVELDPRADVDRVRDSTRPRLRDVEPAPRVAWLPLLPRRRGLEPPNACPDQTATFLQTDRSSLGRILTNPVLTESTMPRVLVIHGAGMNMRGKVQVDIFGPMTLPEYDERIRGYAKELGVDVEIFHSNIEGEIVNRLYTANDQGFDAAIFNPAAFGTGYPALVAAISQVKFPTIEVHISNPIRRGPASQTAAVSQSVVAGFGIAGYALALRGIRDMVAAKK